MAGFSGFGTLAGIATVAAVTEVSVPVVVVVGWLIRTRIAAAAITATASAMIGVSGMCTRAWRLCAMVWLMAPLRLDSTTGTA